MKHSSMPFLLVLSLFLVFFASADSLAVWTGQWYSKDPYPDYAPEGVPDFDQHLYDPDQRWGWGKVPGIQDPNLPENNPDNPAWQWTWDGPVAWANSVWWMDSRFESYFNPSPVPPPIISDSFPLVYSPDPSYDDHARENVLNVVGELAMMFWTDGDPYCAWSGTDLMYMLYGLQMGLDQLGLGKWSHVPPGPYFVVGKRQYPAFYEIVREVHRCQDVVLLLGLYEEDPTGAAPGEYLRVGGHYVTVVAVEGQEKLLRISDPFLDLANPGPGPWEHFDAAIVSHDQYQARDLLPLGCALVDYPWSAAGPGDPLWDGLSTNFKGVNPSPLPPVFVSSPGMGFLTLVEHMIHLSPEWDDDLYQKPPYTDYAPLGVPDFDQRQDLYGKVPGLPSPDDPNNNPQNPFWRWTWCGPVALANSLWWMDSKMEEIILYEQGQVPIPPPERSDNFPLLRRYGEWDDHDPQNVQPFVSDLGTRMKVDGGAQWCAWLGTLPTDLRDATIGYLKEKGLYAGGAAQPEGIYFEVGLTPDPTFEAVSKEVYRCQDVILLLGFYEFTPEGQYVRIGGHYVTCVGVDRRGSRVKLSDPIVDTLMPAMPASGKEQPLQLPEDHNDAAIVSHDEYHIGTLSDGEFWLTDYPWSLGPESEWREIWEFLRFNFEGANPHDLPPLDILHSCEYITKVEYMLHVSPVFWFWKGKGDEAHHDYAQAGVPDFSQKQGKLGKVPGILDPSLPENNPQNPNWQWTWCGPVAVANSLWWLDSQFETLMTPVGAAPVKPPAISDHFPLVEAPPVGGMDDHHAANVLPLINDVAKQMKTDGEPFCTWEGTRVEDMVEGIKTYLEIKNLAQHNTIYDFWFDVGLTKDPDLYQHIAIELRRCQDVVLLLGFYRLEQGFYTRVGGHYVTVAGVSERERLIAVCDPWMDTVAGDNGPSGPGRFGIPHDPVPHKDDQHNDADFVSHDVYRVGVLPDAENFLEDYPWSDMGDPQMWEKIERNFWGQNKPREEFPPPEIEPIFNLLTKIEFMVHVSPVGKPVAVPQVVPQHASCGQTVTFDGTASYHTNPTRSIVKYEWDFDGDGVYDATGAVVSHAYSSFGTYHGSLRVTDDDIPQGWVESFFDVYVDQGNNPPVADANGPYAIDEGFDLALDGSGSSDPDGGCGDFIVSWKWDLDGDGDYDDAVGEKPTVPWSVIAALNLKRYPDTNDIALKVQDMLGDTGTDATTLTIYQNRPVAVFTASPNPADVGQTVTFDASASYHTHPLHSIVSYRWDFDGDGSYDASGQVVTHSYGTPGTYPAELLVTDDNTPPKTDRTVVDVLVQRVVPPEEIAVGLGMLGRGYFEMVDANNYLLTHNVWKHVPGWRGETRPALGDFDGDGDKEIVVGLGGGGGGGRLALFDDRSTGYAFMGWRVIPWPAYNAMNGETWPACGDVDGDSRDEIVVGLGPGGGGWFFIFDDAGTGYALMAVRQIPNLIPPVVIVTAAHPGYNATNGETRPAVGDIDGDGKEEIVIGLGGGAGGYFCLFDDGLFGFPFKGWKQIPYPAYNMTNGETWPVTGDVDGDVKEEMILGLGTYPANGGWMYFFDDPVAGGILGKQRLPWMGYNTSNGETHPATCNIDTDASAELVVGLGDGGCSFMWIADHWGTGGGGTGIAGVGWYWIPWGAYAWSQGLSYPRAKAIVPLSDEPAARESVTGDPLTPHESLYGRISGNVSSGGSPVEGAWVTAFSDTWDPTISTRTDASGNYLLEGLPPGTYYPLADPPPTPIQGKVLAPEYYDDVPGIPSARGLATPVTVYAAIETSGIDFDLAAGGTISGTVTTISPQPAPLQGAIVTAYVEAGSWEQFAQAEADGQGIYLLQGLPPGTYYLEAQAPEPGYLGEYYDDLPAIESNQALATGIAVSAGAEIVGKNFALGRGASISGKVTGQAGQGSIEGATVILYQGGGGPGGAWTSVSTTFSGATGDYEFAGLPAGTYYIEAGYPAGGYAGEYYDNVGALLMNRPSATAVTLAAGDSQSGKNFLLAQGGVIEGKVTEALAAQGIGRVVVTVYEDDFGAAAGQTTTDSNGDYSVGNLPTGSYRVSADAGALTLTSQYYDGQPMTEEGKARSTSVVVTAGTTVSSINFSLQDKVTVSGSVTDDGNPANPIEGAIVMAYNTNWDPVSSATTAPDGSYEIAVEAGEYYFAAEGLGYALEFFEEATNRTEARLVSAVAQVTPVNFTLKPVGTIVVISNVPSAPFSLTDSPGDDTFEGNTATTRIWSQTGVQAETWTIRWGDVPGYNTPPDKSEVLNICDTLTFFGEYPLAEGFRVNVLNTTGTDPDRRLVIQWYSEVGQMYQVQKTNDLVLGSWQNVGDPQPGTGAMMSLELPFTAMDPDRDFFRVRAY